MKIQVILFMLAIFSAHAQKDSLPKIHHAEPLYMDLIRDLGARRGERELNIGGNFQRTQQYMSYSSFIEYEFAPFNRLGMEIEIPVSFYQNQSFDGSNPPIPKNRIEGLKLSLQYTFLVAPEKKLSMATGYTNQLAFHSFKTVYNENKITKGNIYSPFLVVAKRWNDNLHTMIITGPMYEQLFLSNTGSLGYQFHVSVFYMILKNNFIGTELNHMYVNDTYTTLFHPQIKYKISPAIAIGLTTEISLHETYMANVFFRIIYEPKRTK